MAKTRAEKRAEKEAAARISRAYHANCSGISINILDIPKVFAFGNAVIAEGADDAVLGDKIKNFVTALSIVA